MKNYRNITPIILALMNCFFITCFGKVAIYTYSYNRPDFIELQHKTFQKFCSDDYELKVFNDATNPKLEKEIEDTCIKLGLVHVRIPQEIHKRPYLKRLPGIFKNKNAPSVRNCNVVQWSLDNYGFDHDDILVLIDSDLFLTEKFSFREYLGKYDIAAYMKLCSSAYPTHSCKQVHPNIDPFNYLWIGLVFLNMPSLPNKRSLNFNCGKVYDTFELDSGGYTHFYLKNNPDVRVRSIERLRIITATEANIAKYSARKHFKPESKKLAREMKALGGSKNIEFYLNDAFVHYGGGSNYIKHAEDHIEVKTNLLNNFMESLLEA